jgi:ABC-type glycerol-3-phosphate transport system substrate-binding protein
MTYQIFNRKLTGIFIILNFLVGCNMHKNQSNNKLHATTNKQIQLNWIGNWKDRESKKKLLLNAVREFELLNQDINVNLKFQEDVCNCSNYKKAINDTIEQMIMSGKINWDIVILTQGMYADIGNDFKDPEWGKKHLVNFEEFDWFREAHKSFIFEVPQYRKDLHGIFAGPLIEGRYYSLWYNNNLAKKIGIEIKSIGMTFEDFKGYVKKAFEYNQSRSEKIQIFHDNSNYSPIPDLFNSLVLSALESADTSSINISKSLNALKKALKACESLAVFNPFSNPELIHDSKSDPMLDEKTLFSVTLSSTYNMWENVDKIKAQNMLPAELPVFEKPSMILHGSFQSLWAVLKNSPHRIEAIKFIQYMCSNDIAEKWISSTKNPSGLNAKINASDLAQDEIGKFNAAIEKKYGNNISNFNIVKILFGPKASFTIDATPVVKGTLTADEYYNQIVKQIKKR